MEIQNCIAVEQFTEEIKGSWDFSEMVNFFQKW